MNPLNPLASLLRCARLGITGRVHFPRARVGEILAIDDQPFRIFRQVVVDPSRDQPGTPGAVFIPRFRVAGMSVPANIRFSLLPIPFYIGLPGFRSKLWLVNNTTGEFAGYYEWDTTQDAENYSRSFAARFMTTRSVLGSVSFRVVARDTARSRD